MIILLVVLVVLRKHGIPDGVVAVGAVLLGAVGSIFYIQGCIALAEAKGYTGAVVASVIIASYCFLPLLFVIPLVLFFGLKDKTKDGTHRR
jgi:drug/metabolite transporter (DMT)-like permease